MILEVKFEHVVLRISFHLFLTAAIFERISYIYLTSEFYTLITCFTCEAKHVEVKETPKAEFRSEFFILVSISLSSTKVQ